MPSDYAAQQVLACKPSTQAVLAGLGVLIELMQMTPALHPDAGQGDWLADCIASGG